MNDNTKLQLIQELAKGNVKIDKGRVSDFLIEVPEWPDGVAQRMLCNRDAVEKLKNMYNFSNDIKEWRGNGVPEQYCILGEQLDAELERMLPKYTFSEE